MTTAQTGTRFLTPQERIAYYQTQLNPFLADKNPILQQHMQFLKESDLKNRAGAAGCAAICIGGGTAVGGYIGSEIGGIIGNFIDDEDGQGTGKMIGGGIGAVIGFVGGFFGCAKLSEKDIKFNKWRQNKQEHIINLHTFIQYSNDLFLKQFICQLTQNIAIAPVRTPTGYLVEHEVIMRFQKDPDGKITCPFTRAKFFPMEVTKNYERAFIINKKALLLIQQDLEAAKENPVQTVFFKKLESSTKEAVEACYQNCILEIEAARISGVITAEECQSKRESFFKTFGGKSTDPLDWSLDWKEILDTRWEKRNPGKKFY